MDPPSTNEFHIEGKYTNDLLAVEKHAVKSQNQKETRTQVDYKVQDLYRVGNASFSEQYNSFYEVRLKEMKPLLIKAAKQMWGDEINVIDEIRNIHSNEDCVIIGTIYKDLSLFKSILNEKISASFNPQLIGTQFLPKNSLHGPLSQEGDPVFLEDSTTRILIKDFPDPIVTGVVLAIRGEMDPNGDFLTKSVCYLHTGIKPIPMQPTPSTPKDAYLLCASDLLIGKSLSLRTHLLFEFISGQLGFVEDVKLCSRIARVVLLGNSMQLAREPFQRIRQDPKEIAETLLCVQNFDQLLNELLPFVPVTIVPGALDATSSLIPQQPLHQSLFTLSMRYSSLDCVSNPYRAVMHGMNVVMTAGQNIQDVARQIPAPLSPIDIMALTLEWGLLFPTDPNTCPGIPLSTHDPFIIQDLPDIYIVGDQQTLQWECRNIGGKEVLLIALPSFANSGEVAMLNLNTKSVSPIAFKTDSIESIVVKSEAKEEEEDIIIDEDIANGEEYCVCYKESNEIESRATSAN